MVLTRSKRRLLDVQPASPTLEITDGTISADNFSPAKRAKVRSPLHLFINFVAMFFLLRRVSSPIDWYMPVF
ncbi:hypothetical protein LguiA_023248 [Lonicera macranthoides]